jgi:hypothetical protein
MIIARHLRYLLLDGFLAAFDRPAAQREAGATQYFFEPCGKAMSNGNGPRAERSNSAMTRTLPTCGNQQPPWASRNLNACGALLVDPKGKTRSTLSTEKVFGRHSIVTFGAPV